MFQPVARCLWELRYKFYSMFLSLFISEFKKLSEKNIYFIIIFHKLINDFYSLIGKFNAVAVIFIYKSAVRKTAERLADART